MQRVLLVVVGILASGCATARAGGKTVVFEGMCDASGAVVLEDGRFAVADDEDNILRVYDSRRGGPPVQVADLSDALALRRGKKRAPETDIEAATRLDGLSFWLTSHGRKSSGKLDESRFRFFATAIRDRGERIEVVGEPYARLAADLLDHPQLKAFDLSSALQLPPKEPGGFNIEGMTAMEDGRSVLIGFRNPVPDGKAIAVPLLNPAGMVRGEPARFGEVKLFDLGGRGIRSISWWRGRYLLVGGSVDGSGTSRLFTWRSGDPQPMPVEHLDFTGLNPEGFFSPEDSDEILVLSDDGAVRIGETECKRLKDPTQKRFRGVWVRLPDPVH